ncbi:hypothetical protein FHG87_025086 [Trinorchestia longiramus]|nr:hypothetical protein FHG87_025086 [Trinorchestia longiramus]
MYVLPASTTVPSLHCTSLSHIFYFTPSLPTTAAVGYVATAAVGAAATAAVSAAATAAVSAAATAAVSAAATAAVSAAATAAVSAAATAAVSAAATAAVSAAATRAVVVVPQQSISLNRPSDCKRHCFEWCKNCATTKRNSKYISTQNSAPFLTNFISCGCVL